MVDGRPPPTKLGSGSRFALHLTDGLLTVWMYHRDLGQHGERWEKVDEYEVPDGVQLSGTGMLVKEGPDVWYLVDDLDDVQIRNRSSARRSGSIVFAED